DDDAVVDADHAVLHYRLIVGDDALQAVRHQPRMADHGEKPAVLPVALDVAPPQSAVVSAPDHHARRQGLLVDLDASAGADRQAGGLLAARFGQQEQALHDAPEPRHQPRAMHDD